jgi:predicted HicB family RNase H-like nuclease
MKSSRWLVCVFAIIALAVAALVPLRAQNDPIPPEVNALFDDIIDIDKLRVLNPLKLTADQLEKISAAVKSSQKDYDKALADAAVPPIKEISKEIKDVRKSMISGSSIPKDFDDKVKAIQEAFVKKRDTADFNSLKGLSEAIKKILTDEQFAKAADLARKFVEKDSKPNAKNTDDKFFNFYVMQLFMRYPRILPLMEEMKKAKIG